MAAAHRRSSPSSSTCFRFCDGRMTRGRPQHGEHVLPDATDRHDLPGECDLADHGQIAADHAPGQRRHNRGHHRNADRGPVLAAARPTARGHGCQRRNGRPGRCGTAPRWTAPTTAPSAPCLLDLPAASWSGNGADRPSARPRRRRRRHPLRRPGRGHGLRPSGLASHQLRALRAEHAPDPDAPPGSLHSSLFRPFPPCVSCPFLSFLRWRSGPAGRGRLHWEVAPPFEKARALRVAGLRGPRPKANGTLVREAARRVDVTPSVTPPQELETSRRSGHDASRPTV